MKTANCETFWSMLSSFGSLGIRIAKRIGTANYTTLHGTALRTNLQQAIVMACLLLGLMASTVAHAQAIKKSGGLGIDLSKLNVPEVPTATSEAPPADSGIVEEAVASPNAPNYLRPEPGALGGGLPGLRGPAFSAGPMTLAAEYTINANGKSGQLLVTATLEGPWHTYSTTQVDGGPKKSTIKITSSGLKLTGPFKSDHEPTINQLPDYAVPVEEHHERVVWSAPFEITGDFKAGETELKVAYDGLVCNDVCQEVRQSLVAKYITTTQTAKPSGYRADKTHATISAYLEPAEVKAGGTATLVIDVQCDPQYHVYEFVPGATDSQFKTLLVPTKKAGLKWGQPLTDSKVHVEKSDSGEVRYHEGKFQWRIPLQVPSNMAEGAQEIELAMNYLTCTSSTCDLPVDALVKGVLNVVKSPGATPQAAFEVGAAPRNLAKKQKDLGTWIDFKSEPANPADDAAKASTMAQATGGLQTGSLSWTTILFALMGGFILNFMPCVLPVIGLKVLGFVEQAGSARSEVIKLNLAYVLGICSVMWVLAGITVATQNTFGWGQQFTKFEFKLAMAALVFAMALSFLGVWEIPIPGFATSYNSNKMMQREGVLGAFSKGLFTTILATPCSGPFLGFVFAVTVTLDPIGVFVVYTMVGLGMGLPFLLLCLRPSAVKMLPKPGAWMETLKEGLSFPLLLTVVYFVASIGADYRIATFSTLIAVWFACWLIGKVPIYADRHVKVKVWSAALAVLTVWGMISFTFLGPVKSDLSWEPYSSTRLNQLRAEGKTVMIDFTANWCFNCQANSRLSIEVPKVVDLVKANGVAPLLADKTDDSPQIDEKLVELQGTTVIPFLVIYPADPKADPIVLSGTFTQDRLVEALKTAGPSRTETKLTSKKGAGLFLAE